MIKLSAKHLQSTLLMLVYESGLKFVVVKETTNRPNKQCNSNMLTMTEHTEFWKL